MLIAGQPWYLSVDARFASVFLPQKNEKANKAIWFSLN